MKKGHELIAGCRLYPDYLDREQQERLAAEIAGIIEAAPLFVPKMPKSGKAMSVRMTNCGKLGWITDKEGGYRYQTFHPETGKPWPPMPRSLFDLWRDLSGYSGLPEACLVNFYDENARMGLHQDRDERNFSAPVVSISLGDDCLFRIGTNERRGPTKSLRLKSGAVIVMGGQSRLAYHGVSRIYPNTSTLLPLGGRINLTLRRVE